jgi:hypothetical protein
MDGTNLDSVAFCQAGVKALMHPWGIRSGMQFRAVPPPDQSGSTFDAQLVGTVVSSSRNTGIVLRLLDESQVRISDEQLRTANYSCPAGSDSRGEQWGDQVVKFSCQAALSMQSVRSPLDYIKDLIEVRIDPDLLTDAAVLQKNSLQGLRKASHQRGSSAGQFSSQGVSCYRRNHKR